MSGMIAVSRYTGSPLLGRSSAVAQVAQVVSFRVVRISPYELAVVVVHFHFLSGLVDKEARVPLFDECIHTARVDYYLGGIGREALFY